MGGLRVKETKRLRDKEWGSQRSTVNSQWSTVNSQWSMVKERKRQRDKESKSQRDKETKRGRVGGRKGKKN